MKKILIIGKGFLGSEISFLANKKDYKVITTNFSKNEKLDITKYDEIKKFIEKCCHEIVINCKAFSDVDEMGTHADYGYATNAIGPMNLGKVCKKENISLIHLSTDSVFDGKKGDYSELDSTNPLNNYARSKRDGEINLLNTYKDALVIRSNFYGYDTNQKFLFNWILNNLKNGKIINAFTDVVFNPLLNSDLAFLILELSKVTHSGILHLSHDEKYSKYEFALTIARELGFNENLIKKAKISKSTLIAERPKNTTLNNSKMKKLLDFETSAFKQWLNENKVKFNPF